MPYREIVEVRDYLDFDDPELSVREEIRQFNLHIKIMSLVSLTLQLIFVAVYFLY